MSGTRRMAQTILFAQKPKNCTKTISFPLPAFSTGNNWPATNDKGQQLMIKGSYPNPRKTRKVLQFSLKQKLWRFRFVVFGGCRQGWGMFYVFLFFYDVIALTIIRNCRSKFGWISG